MEFIQIAYSCIAIFLVIIAKLHYNEKWKRFGANLLATANILLVFYGVFLIQQLVGVYHIAKQTAEIMEISRPSAPESLQWFLGRQLALIIIPFLFLWKKLQTNLLLIALVLVLLYWDHPVAIWNLYNLDLKILSYLCLFCSGYAMLWLLDLLPYQSSPD